LTRYRKALRRRRNTGIFGKRGIFGGRRRNPAFGKKPIAVVKETGMLVAQGGGGFISAMLVGKFVGQAVNAQYGPVLGNLAVLVGSQMIQTKYKKAKFLGDAFTVGAAAASYVGAMNLAISKNIIPMSLVPYLAPWAVSSAAVLPAVGGVAGLGAYVQQEALYGMGGDPIAQGMQHKLKMIEGGMQGGLFDAPTVLGEYDVLDSAPAGTTVQGALAAYETYPPMGAVVEQATAGMGATVQEAFAGPSLKEYVSTPLSDYVPTGGPQQYWGASPQGSAILGKIRNAAATITQERAAAGLPTGEAFKQQLTQAAMATVSAQPHAVSSVHPPSPNTNLVPFPGAWTADQGGVAGQPASIGGDDSYMEDEDGGIFS
jgi:hypothetical protein